jgi:hypothetical protein
MYCVSGFDRKLAPDALLSKLQACIPNGKLSCKLEVRVLGQAGEASFILCCCCRADRWRSECGGSAAWLRVCGKLENHRGLDRVVQGGMLNASALLGVGADAERATLLIGWIRCRRKCQRQSDRVSIQRRECSAPTVLGTRLGTAIAMPPEHISLWF